MGPAGEAQRVIVRSLSASEPVEVELLRFQRQMEEIESKSKHECSGVISKTLPDKIRYKKCWNNGARRKNRGRSRCRYYEPSLERFPPPSVTNSKLRVCQEMPFWRLDYNRFRGSVSSFETREQRTAKWRLVALSNMPFSNVPWKKISNLFAEPDPAKLARRRLKKERRMRFKKEKRRVSQDNLSNKKKIELKQRPHSTSERTGLVTGGAETPTEPIHFKIKKPSPSPVSIKTSESLVTDKPPIPTKEQPTPSETTTPNSIRMRVSGPECQSCERRAYRAESIEALGQVFHSACFRCAECSRVLQRGNWYHRDDKFYCNPCNRKLSLLTFRH
ncbi:hypothetical protein Aperf_G00000103273 [Anoplocephala perfoliata]